MTGNRFEGMIGLAMRAGKVRAGELPVEESIKKGKACVCFLASDASERTAKKVRNMCEFRSISLYKVSQSKEALGKAIGRGEISALTIEDKGFAENAVRLTEGGIVSE